MVVYPDRLGATLAALADPTRRAILARLASGEASVTELAAPFAMSTTVLVEECRRTTLTVTQLYGSHEIRDAAHGARRDCGLRQACRAVFLAIG